MLIEILPTVRQSQLIEEIKDAVSRIAEGICKLVEKVFTEVRDEWVLRQIIAIIDSDATIWDKLVKIEKKRKMLPSRIEEAYKIAIANIDDNPDVRWSKACAFFKDLR